MFHEVMHGFVGLKLGDDTALRAGRLSFNPLRHIDPFLSVILPFILLQLGLPVFGAMKPVPYNPARVKFGEVGAALIALSGPLTNLGLAVLFGLPLRFYELSGAVEGLLGVCVAINLGFFVFNILPIPPLDGSRVLYAFAPDGLRDLMTRIESMGLLGVFLFVMLFAGFLGSWFVMAIRFLFYLITGHTLVF